MTPSRMVFDGPTNGQTTTVTARYSDGSTRDVTALARFSSNNATTATIDENGRVQAGRRGDTFVFARFNRFTIGAEVVVLPIESDFRWPDVKAANFIDDLVFARLKELHLAPSEVCTDEQFLRRAYLDLIGLPPTVEEYRLFLANPSPDRRTQLVDELLNRDEFADLWASKWGEALEDPRDRLHPARQRREGGRGVPRLDSRPDGPQRPAR